jgi:hypothetical protein
LGNAWQSLWGIVEFARVEKPQPQAGEMFREQTRFVRCCFGKSNQKKEQLMTAKAPPVPQQNLSDKGPGEDPHSHDQKAGSIRPGVPDPAKQGQQGNTKINLTPQLSTQDR